MACLGSAMLAGCGAARDAAVVSYRVATAPVKLARRALEKPSPTPGPVTSTTDVDVPGRPVAASSPKPKKRRVTESSSATTATRSNRTQSSAVKSTPDSASGAQAEFPLAKPVPGRPGYVYSPYDPSKYVDVSGYTSGSKVKDPFVHKIFIVP